MKANEAPEKIYISPKVFNIGVYVTKVLTTKYEDNIEYIRADAFIEKATEWLNEHILDYVYAKMWGQGVGVEVELFEDFEEYLKKWKQ
jgi:hypothetical protein